QVLAVDGSMFAGNMAVTGVQTNPATGGAIVVGGVATVTNSTFSNNQSDYRGGAICVDSSSLDLRTSTLSSNSLVGGASGGGGGGIWANGNLAVVNATITANSATGNGGGVYLAAPVSGVPPNYLQNTMIVNSSSGGNCSGDAGAVTSGGGNLSNDTSCTSYFN